MSQLSRTIARIEDDLICIKKDIQAQCERMERLAITAHAQAEGGHVAHDIDHMESPMRSLRELLLKQRMKGEQLRTLRHLAEYR